MSNNQACAWGADTCSASRHSIKDTASYIGLSRQNLRTCYNLLKLPKLNTFVMRNAVIHNLSNDVSSIYCTHSPWENLCYGVFTNSWLINPEIPIPWRNLAEQQKSSDGRSWWSFTCSDRSIKICLQIYARFKYWCGTWLSIYWLSIYWLSIYWLSIYWLSIYRLSIGYRTNIKVTLI